VLANGGVWIRPNAAFDSVKKRADYHSAQVIRQTAERCRALPYHSLAERELPDYQKGARIGTLCTGSFVLARTGLLDGKNATTNWLYVKKFQRLFPRVRLKPDQILTEDDGLICSGALTAMYNLALHVIEIFGSEALSRKCAKILLVDHNRQSQRPYMVEHFKRNHGDRQILDGQHWFEKNFADRFSIDDVTAVVGLSPRHFKRRFKKATGENPLHYLQKIRQILL